MKEIRVIICSILPFLEIGELLNSSRMPSIGHCRRFTLFICNLLYWVGSNGLVECVVGSVVFQVLYVGCNDSGLCALDFYLRVTLTLMQPKALR